MSHWSVCCYDLPRGICGILTDNSAIQLTVREKQHKVWVIFLAQKSRSIVKISWFRTWLLLNNTQPFHWAYRLHTPLPRVLVLGLWERERSWSRKKRGLPGCAENWGFPHSCFKVYCLRQRYWSRCFPLNKRIQPQIACWSLITLLFSEGFSFTSREI